MQNEKNQTKSLSEEGSEVSAQMGEIEENAIAKFKGQLNELESAIGMLRIGKHMGWRVLVLIHSKRTIRKYEKILDVKIRNIFPERGQSSHRSIGLLQADQSNNFWKAVSGEIKISNRNKITQ